MMICRWYYYAEFDFASVACRRWAGDFGAIFALPLMPTLSTRERILRRDAVRRENRPLRFLRRFSRNGYDYFAKFFYHFSAWKFPTRRATARALAIFRQACSHWWRQLMLRSLWYYHISVGYWWCHTRSRRIWRAVFPRSTLLCVIVARVPIPETDARLFHAHVKMHTTNFSLIRFFSLDINIFIFSGLISY